MIRHPLLYVHVFLATQWETDHLATELISPNAFGRKLSVSTCPLALALYDFRVLIPPKAPQSQKQLWV